MTCVACSSELRAGAAFCTKCGAAQPAQPVPPVEEATLVPPPPALVPPPPAPVDPEATIDGPVTTPAVPSPGAVPPPPAGTATGQLAVQLGVQPPLPPLPPVPAALPPLPSGPPRRSRLVPILALVGAVAILAGVVTGLLMMRKDPKATDTAQPPAAAATADPAPEPTPDPAAPAAGQATPAAEPATSAPPAPAVTCWNGSPAAELAACPKLEGKPGFRWVFPSLCPTPRDEPHSAQRERILACDGEPYLNFTRWKRIDDMLEYYRGLGAPVSIDAERVRFDGVSHGGPRDGWHKIAIAYRDAPWGVTIYARDRAAADAAAAQLQMRPVAELRGTPVP